MSDSDSFLNFVVGIHERSYCWNIKKLAKILFPETNYVERHETGPLPISEAYTVLFDLLGRVRLPVY